MRAALLSVGTELLLGEITNTNTVYLSQQLSMLGIDVLYHYTVGDNPERLAETIETAFRACDLVITTGGLGPTQDDMTKEIACRVMGDRLVMHEDILESIRKRILAYKTVMTDNNRKQAELPSRCIVFYNDAGTAPGFALERESVCGDSAEHFNGDIGEKPGKAVQCIICMPGPPREMTRMFEKSVRPWLEAKSDARIVFREIRTFGIGESDLETRLLPLIEGQTDPTIATYAKESESSVRVASKRKNADEAEAAVSEMVKKVQDLVGEYIYSTDNEELVELTCRKLMDKGISISSAESCTGGIFAAALTDIPGISAVFDRGIVTYSNRAKVEELGVREETLDRYGAVSEETAREMAEGIQRVSRTDIGISVTGVAGPGGGSPDKPVGLVYIAMAYKGETRCRKIDRRIKDRRRNRLNALMNMLDMINRSI